MTKFPRPKFTNKECWLQQVYQLSLNRRIIPYKPRLSFDEIKYVGHINRGAWGKVYHVNVNEKRAALKQLFIAKKANKPEDVYKERDLLILL